MKLNHTSYTNHWHENRLIFRQTAIKSAVQQNADLPTEYALGEDILANRIKELDRETRLSGNRGRVAKIMSSISGNKDWNIDELRLKKEICQKKLDELKSPIDDSDGLRNAMNDIDSYEKMLTKLRNAEIDSVDIENLLGIGSDFGAFFSEGLSKKLEDAKEKMSHRERASNALLSYKSDPKLVNQAESEWEAAKITELKKGYKADWINRRIDELEAEQEVNVENASLKIEDIEGMDEGQKALIHKQAESEESRKNRIHKLTLQKEKENAIRTGSILPHEDKLELTNILLEAKAIRMERVKEYLSKRFTTVNEKFKLLKDKKPYRLGRSEAKEMERFLKGFETQVLNGTEIYKSGTQAIMQASENMDRAESMLTNLAPELEFVDELAKDPEKFKAGIMRKVGVVKSAIQAFTPERVGKLLEKLDLDEKARISSLKPGEATKNDIFGKSPIYIKNRTALMELGSEGSHLKKQMAEVETLMQEMETMDPEEILEIRTSLDAIQQTLEGFSGDKIDKALGTAKRSNAEIARRAINLLQGTTDTDKIKQILEENLGKDHFEVVSGQQFENYIGSTGNKLNLKEYTDGNMVFYERGDSWKVIINEEGLTDGKALQEQITHELLHLEFESNEELKKEWLRLFTENSEWQNIRQTFFSAFPNKKAPTEAGWKDEDILSEIFAMQNDIFAASPESGKLQRAIIDAGITAAALGIPAERIRGYAKEEGVHGAEMGNEAEGNSSKELSNEGMENPFETNKEGIEKNDKEIKRILTSEYINYIPSGAEALNLMKKFNEETAEINEKYKKTTNSFIIGSIKKRIEDINGDVLDIEKQISQVADKIQNTGMNPLRDMWNRTKFFSLDDILQVGNDIKEWWERRHKRKKAEHAANIGSAVFDKIPLPVVSEFGVEAGARALKAEHGEVDEWKGRLAHKDAWELEEMIEKMSNEANPNKDMFKAVLKVLASKGRINWRSPFLWRLLNKLQNATELAESGGHHPKGDTSILKNPILLREKLNKAIGAIWDKDEYATLDRENGSNYGSGKEKYFKGFAKIQDQLGQRLEQLIDQHESGGKVDPQEYEGLIHYCIKDGKSTAEAIFFYMIAGVAKGILYADRPLALDADLMNNFPSLEWISNHKPSLTKADYIEIANKHFPNSMKNSRMGADFKKFFWTVVNNNISVTQRVRKAVVQRLWDHDWGRAIAPLGDANTAKQFLSGRSGQQEVQDTAVENVYVGALQWLEQNAELPNNVDLRKNFARQVGWITMADGILDRVVWAGGIYASAGASVLQAVPREAGTGNHPDTTVAGHRNIIRSLLDQLDPPFYKLIRDEARAKSEPKAMAAEIRDYLIKEYPSLKNIIGGAQELPHIFEQMDAIIQAIVFKYSASEFNAIVKKWRATATK